MLDNQLIIFKKVVEKNSFSAAAQELNMTQSAVSQHIQALEDHFGTKLFDRLHRRVRLTEAGITLYPYAVRLERLYQEASEAMSGKPEVTAGKLYISASLTIGELLLPKLLVQFYSYYPNIRILLNIEAIEKVIENTFNGVSDVGFVEGVYEQTPELDDLCFNGDELVVIAPPSIKISGPVSLVSLLKEKWVMQESGAGVSKVFEHFISMNGYDPSELNVVMSTNKTESVKSAVLSMGGLGITSKLAVNKEIEHGKLKVIQLCEGSIHRKFWMLRNKSKYETRTVERFCSFLLHNYELKLSD